MTRKSILCWSIYLLCFIVARIIVAEIEIWRFALSALVIALGFAALSYRDNQ